MVLACLLADLMPGTARPAAAQSLAPPAPIASPLGDLLGQARRRLDAGQPEAAYRLLEPRSALYAGSVDFDYLLGLAALDSGRPGEAVLALERVLAAEPGNLPARAEIGRAYLELRELESARRELETVARSELPPQVRDTVRRYLDTVARLGEGRRPKWIVQMEVAGGWDTNVNFGSSFGEWVLSDGQSLVPLPASQPRSSAFAAVSAGVTYVAPISGRLDWTAGLQLAQRINPSQHNVDTGSAELSTGLAMATGAHRYSMSLQYQHLRLDDAAFRDAIGAIAQWQWDSGPRTQVGAFVQAFDLAFPDQRVRDALRRAAGATLAHGLGGPRAPTFAASLYGGDERAGTDVPQLSFDFAGIRTAAGATLAPRWRMNVGWSYERREFQAIEPLFGALRIDRQHDLRAALEYDVDRSLTIAPAIAWTRNASSVAPNDFRRTQAFVYARYRF
jgi:tetratricopeptide (TPR) repeat protein